jgi:hypothetical protein
MSALKILRIIRYRRIKVYYEYGTRWIREMKIKLTG